MRKQISHCDKGDIILIPFPFTDLSNNKLRPCVVLAKDKDDMIVVFITSQKPKGANFLEITPTKDNGIKVKSFIRYTKIATLEQAMSLGLIGKLDIKSHKALLKALLNYLSI